MSAKQEISRGFYCGWYWNYVDALPLIEQGFVTGPDVPGLGLQLLPDVQKRGEARLRV